MFGVGERGTFCLNGQLIEYDIPYVSLNKTWISKKSSKSAFNHRFLGSKQTPTDSKRDLNRKTGSKAFCNTNYSIWSPWMPTSIDFQGGGNFFSRSMVNENDEKT